MTTQTPAVVAAHIASTHHAVAAVAASLDAAVAALAYCDAVSAEDAIRTAKAKLTAAAVAARRLTATVHRVQRPGKTSAEALLRRGDPAGVIAELFVITPNREAGQVSVQHDDKKAIDKIVWSCWPTVYSKYGVDLPEGCADALARAWKAYLRANGGLAFCCVAGEYAAIARAGR